MKKLFFITNMLIGILGFSQEKYNPLSKPNTYQNSDNPNYWKNKMPNKAYWQQDVHYKIQAKIDEKTDIILASEQLIYTNNLNTQYSRYNFQIQ